MDQLYDSGLFSELGELMAHDQVFYEDIPKQHNLYSSSPVDDVQYLQPSSLNQSPLGSGDELETLLEEGNQMLDRFMAENGLDLLSTPVDLTDVDELINTTYTPLKPAVAIVEDTSYDNYAQQVSSPTSSISTLPSEPSSPVDLFPMERQASTQSEPLADLLESLLSEHEDQVDYSHYDYEVASPASSYTSSELSTSYEDNSIYVSQNQWDDNSSTYTQSIYSPAPSVSPVPTPVSEEVGKCAKPKKKSRSIPYSKLPAGRKERKKQQNKEAAIRYREKKRSEAVQSQNEEQILTDRNKELKTEVLNLEREIMCMKELLSDVFNIHSI